MEKNWDTGELHVHELGMKASALAVIDRERQLIVSEHGLFVRERANGRLTCIIRWRRIMKSPVPTMPAYTLPARSGSAPWAKGREGCRVYLVVSRRSGEETLLRHYHHQFHLLFAGWQDRLFRRYGLQYRLAGRYRPGNRPACFGKSVFHHRTEEGGMDGSVVDADGLLWNACWGGSALNVYSPQGRLIRSITLPVRQPSCPAFVGPEAAAMVVTSAHEGLSDEARCADPHAGRFCFSI